MNSLDKKSIASFLRVTGDLSKASSENNTATTAVEEVTSGIESFLKEGENIRLILRSNGHEFPAKDCTDDSNFPAYIVCLAHHVPSDQFILFAFNSITMPCRLIRYDRDGNVIENNNLFWDTIDAAVLVAAVNKCHEGNAAYFDRAGCTSSDVKRRGECLRLVNTNNEAEGVDEEMMSCQEKDEEDRDKAKDDEDEVDDDDQDEYEAIRSVILTELLKNGQEGGDFHHPDPSFLLPLSESISQELYRWRCLCNHIPPRSEWPKLPSPGDATNVKGMSLPEKEELDELLSKRNSQLKNSVEYCQNAMEKLKSLLCKILERGNEPTATYELGKEGIVSLTTLEFMNQENAEQWPDFHEQFEEVDQTCYDAAHEIKNSLMTWDNSGCVAPEGSDEEDNSDWEEDDNYIEVALKLVNAWTKEDKALLKSLSNVVTNIDEALKSEEQSLQSAIDRIDSELSSILSLQKDAGRKTQFNATRFIKLWHGCPEEKEEEPWLQSATVKPQWTTDNLESHISFGWGETEHEVPSVMNFVIDSAGLMASLEGCVTSITTYTTHYSQTKFDSIWAKKIQRTVNSTLDGIKALLASGDLRNASILSLCCLRVFCDGDTIGAVRYWFENNESYDGQYDDDAIDEMFMSKFQGLWEMYHPYVAAIALACFDVESPKREAGAHWFLDALQSGLVYAPSNPSGE